LKSVTMISPSLQEKSKLKIIKIKNNLRITNKCIQINNFLYYETIKFSIFGNHQFIIFSYFPQL
jgi:hypothetical protein